MERSVSHILYLDDYHAGDVHFVHSLARGLGRLERKPAPAIVHGSAEHAERMLEAGGIFRRREHGVLPIESKREHQLVERAARELNQKIVAILSDAVVASVGVFGTQRRTLIVRGDEIEAASVDWIRRMMEQGIVPVIAAFAQHEESGGSGEIPLVEAVSALAGGLGSTEIVIFTKTNLPGVMEGGQPMEYVNIDHPKLEKSVPDLDGLKRLHAAGLTALLTNTTRFADESGPTGTRITPVNEE